VRIINQVKGAQVARLRFGEERRHRLPHFHTFILRGNARPLLLELGLEDLKGEGRVLLGGTSLLVPGRPGGGALFFRVPDSLLPVAFLCCSFRKHPRASERALPCGNSMRPSLVRGRPCLDLAAEYGEIRIAHSAGRLR
jgi:hypothetical protein